MPKGSQKKGKRGGGRGGSYSETARVTDYQVFTLATGVSQVFNLDPISFGQPATTLANVHQLYMLERLEVVLLPSGETSNAATAHTRCVALVPGTNTSNPTTCTVAQAASLNKVLMSSSAETVDKVMIVSGKYLHQSSPTKAYYCEPDADASTSQEIQAQLQITHDSTSTSIMRVKMVAIYRFTNPMGSAVNPGPSIPAYLKKYVKEQLAVVQLPPPPPIDGPQRLSRIALAIAALRDPACPNIEAAHQEYCDALVAGFPVGLSHFSDGDVCSGKQAKFKVVPADVWSDQTKLKY